MNDYITIAVLASVLLIAAAWGWREERREKRRRDVMKRLNEAGPIEPLLPRSKQEFEYIKGLNERQYLEGVHPKYKNYNFLPIVHPDGTVEQVPFNHGEN